MSGAAFEAKKVRGSKSGAHIEIVAHENPARLVIGEGIEKVLAVWRALERLGRDLSTTAFWTSVDLGNLGGRAADSVPHPTLKDKGGRTRKVPGPTPDLSSQSIDVPDTVTEIVILGDATSDDFATRCAIARAAARWARPDRTIKVAWCWPEADFDDVLRTEQPLDAACARVVAAFDAAQPAEIPELSGSSSQGQTKTRRQARPKPGSPSAAPDHGAAESSQMGVSEDDSYPGEVGGRGGGHDGVPEGPDELNRRLAWFPQTDLGNAERFVQRQRGKLMHCESVGWLWWDGRRWAREGADQQVRRAEHETVRAIQMEAKALAAEAERGGGRDAKKGKRKDLLKAADALARWGRKSEANGKIVSIEDNAGAYLAVNTSQLDADLMMFNVLNGTLVVRRTWANGLGEMARGWQRCSDYVRLKPHDPSDLITKLAPVKYDPDAGREQFDRFLSEVQPDIAMRRFLQQWKGYSLTADASEHCMALFIGQGRNGKSVFEDATAHVGGDYAETVPIETFLASGREANANAPSPARALLHNARMVRTSEPNRGSALDEGFIKLVTGGEPIQARNLNLPMFRFYPVLKLTVSGNHRPKVGGTDEGIWSRVKLVLWEIIIPPEKRDRALTAKLRLEASGILNWMLDGLVDWIEHGLVFPEKVIKATAEYRSDSDQLGRFLEVCVRTRDGLNSDIARLGLEGAAKECGVSSEAINNWLFEKDWRAQSSVLHAVFNGWARANGGAEWSNKGLTAAMRDRGFKSDKSSVIYWLGIKLIKHESEFPAAGGRVGSAGSTPPPHSGEGVLDREDLRF